MVYEPKAESAEVVQALLDRVPEEPVSLEEARRVLRSEPPTETAGGEQEKSGNLVEAVQKKRKVHKALDVVPWSRFDTIRRDGRLIAVPVLIRPF